MKLSQTPYASVMESLLFVMICTRPNIPEVVRVVSRFIAILGREHWNIFKRIFRYIKGTSNVTLCFRGSKFIVEGYID